MAFRKSDDCMFICTYVPIYLSKDTKTHTVTHRHTDICIRSYEYVFLFSSSLISLLLLYVALINIAALSASVIRSSLQLVWRYAKCIISLLAINYGVIRSCRLVSLSTTFCEVVYSGIHPKHIKNHKFRFCYKTSEWSYSIGNEMLRVYSWR